MTTATLHTAAGLLELLKLFGPAVEGNELMFGADPPADLERVIGVLHSGLRSVLTGRPWWGCGTDRGTARPVRLDPAAPIPWGVTLLCVGGDERWDRIDPAARLDLPDLFAPALDRDNRPGARR